MSDIELRFGVPADFAFDAPPSPYDTVRVGLTPHAESPTQIVGARGPIIAATPPVEVATKKFAKLHDGRFVTVGRSYDDRSEATVWNSDGRTMDHVLPNPIEAEDPKVTWINDVQITHDGRLFVARPYALQVFDPDLSSSVLVADPAGRVGLGRGAVLSDDTWVSSDPTYAGEHSDWFHVLASDGSEIRSFCEVPSGIPRNSLNAPLPRAVARLSDELFVAAPCGTLSEPGYVLEVWSIEGDLVRRVHRSPSTSEWWADPVGFGETSDGALPRVHVQEDGSGLIWVFTMERTSAWRDIEDRHERARSQDELYRRRVDAIDPMSWTLVFSGLVDASQGGALPNPLRHTRLAHRDRTQGPGRNLVHLKIVPSRSG